MGPVADENRQHFLPAIPDCPTPLLRASGQPPDLADQYEFKSVELKQTAFRIDGVFLPTQRDRPVYFVEVQFQKDNLLYHRFFAEILLYLKQYPHTFDWHSWLIYPSRIVVNCPSG